MYVGTRRLSWNCSDELLARSMSLAALSLFYDVLDLNLLSTVELKAIATRRLAHSHLVCAVPVTGKLTLYSTLTDLNAEGCERAVINCGGGDACGSPSGVIIVTQIETPPTAQQRKTHNLSLFSLRIVRSL